MNKIKFMLGTAVGMIGMAFLPFGGLVHAADTSVTESTNIAVPASVTKEVKWAVVIPSEITIDAQNRGMSIQTLLEHGSLLEKGATVNVRIAGDNNFYQTGNKMLGLEGTSGSDVDDSVTMHVSPEAALTEQFKQDGTIAQLTSKAPYTNTGFSLPELDKTGNYAGEYASQVTFAIEYKNNNTEFEHN